VERERLIPKNFACRSMREWMEELSPRLFSFNSPYGAPARIATASATAYFTL